MAYGYRNDGGRYIGSLIQNYRDHEYRKSRDEEMDARYDESIAYQRERDAESDRRATSTHNQQVAQYERKVRNQGYEDEAAKQYELLNKADTGKVGYHKLTKELSTGKKVDLTHLAVQDPAMMKYLNESRGNSGSGSGIFGQLDPKDGSVGLFTKNDKGEFLPFTVDPSDNSSVQLRVAGENVEPMLKFMSGVNEATEGKPELQRQHASNNGGLVMDEKGNVTVGGFQTNTETDPSDLPPELGTPNQAGKPQSFKNDIAHVKESFDNGGVMGVGNEGIRQMASTVSSVVTGENEAINALAEKVKPFLKTGATGFVKGYEFLFGRTGEIEDKPVTEAEVIEVAKAVAKEPKAVQKRLKLVMGDLVQGVDQRPSIRAKISSLYIKSGRWSVSEAENFKATGNHETSLADVELLELKGDKLKADFLKSQLKYQSELTKYRGNDPESIAKRFDTYRKFAPKFIERGLQAMGMSDYKGNKALTNQAAKVGIAFDAVFEHSGMDPDEIKQYGASVVISKAAQVFTNMNKGDIKFETAFAALAAINKGFEDKDLVEYGRAFKALAEKKSEKFVFDALNKSKVKGVEATALLYEMASQIK